MSWRSRRDDLLLAACTLLAYLALSALRSNTVHQALVFTSLGGQVSPLGAGYITWGWLLPSLALMPASVAIVVGLRRSPAAYPSPLAILACLAVVFAAYLAHVLIWNFEYGRALQVSSTWG